MIRVRWHLFKRFESNVSSPPGTSEDERNPTTPEELDPGDVFRPRFADAPPLPREGRSNEEALGLIAELDEPHTFKLERLVTTVALLGSTVAHSAKYASAVQNVAGMEWTEDVSWQKVRFASTAAAVGLCLARMPFQD